MGGLSFIHAGFLAGAIAVAVPIAIHLLFRQKPRRVDIGSVWLLKVVLREHVRRRKVRRWILLALRVAAVMLLALLFARPYRAGAPASGTDQELVILIDQSASMSAAPAGGKTVFQRAQEEAERLLGGLSDGSIARLAYSDDSGVDPARTATVDHTRKAGYGGTDHGLALSWARDVMLASPRARRRVIYISDLQRSGSGRTELDGWPPEVAFDVIDVGRPPSQNIAVTGAVAEQTDIHSGEPFRVTATVTNTGLFAVEKVPVHLTLKRDGTELTKVETLSIHPGERRRMQFSFPEFRPGLYEGSVTAETRDDISADDRRWLAFEARAAARVLLVDGDPGESVYASATYYLEMAIRLKPPGVGDRSASPYVPVRATRNRAQALPALTGYPVVALCNVGDLSDAEASALREYVTGGGRLMVFAGGHLVPSDIERLRTARVLPAVLESAEPGEYRFATWQKEHPLLSALSDPQHGDLRTLVFRTVARVKPDPEARILASAQTGDPLIIESKLGTGKVLLFAFAADREWGDWPISRLYVPLVHQALGYLTDRLAETQRVRTEPTGPGQTHPPGIENPKNLIVTRNLEPRESEAERIDVKEFVQTYHLPQGNAKLAKAANEVPLPPGSQRPDEYWRVVVWGLFGVLLVESCLANRT